jgi:RNA polymerase sigma-70 factor (ECF subfamily)
VGLFLFSRAAENRQRVCAMSPERQPEIERVYRHNEAMLVRWLTAKLGDADAARDVAQSTFIRVWSYASENEVSSPKSLIFKTAARLALNEIRRRNRFSKRNVFTNDLMENEENLPSNADHAGPSPEENAVLKQEAALTLSTIESLPPKIRLAFKLHRFDGLSYQQIADRMNVSKSSVEKYMIEALKSLREKLLPVQASEVRCRKRDYNYAGGETLFQHPK